MTAIYRAVLVSPFVMGGSGLKIQLHFVQYWANGEGAKPLMGVPELVIHPVEFQHPMKVHMKI